MFETFMGAIRKNGSLEHLGLLKSSNAKAIMTHDTSIALHFCSSSLHDDCKAHSTRVTNEHFNVGVRKKLP